MTARRMERDGSPQSPTPSAFAGKSEKAGGDPASPASKNPSTLRKTARKTAPKKQWERPRGGAAKAVSDLVPDIGRAAFRRFGFVQANVVSRWPDIVGARHAEACRPEMIRFPMGQKDEGTLHLVVRAAHAPLIQHVIPEIIERVNRFFGYRAVAQVRLRQGNVSDAHKKPALSRPAQDEAPIPLEMSESLRDIEDPQLRKLLESLARSIDAKEKDRS